jgi:hypothetical protein
MTEQSLKDFIVSESKERGITVSVFMEKYSIMPIPADHGGGYQAWLKPNEKPKPKETQEEVKPKKLGRPPKVRTHIPVQFDLPIDFIRKIKMVRKKENLKKQDAVVMLLQMGLDAYQDYLNDIQKQKILSNSRK